MPPFVSCLILGAINRICPDLSVFDGICENAKIKKGILDNLNNLLKNLAL